MKPVGDYLLVSDSADLTSKLRAIRVGSSSYTTNYFSDIKQTEEWVAKGILFQLEYPGCLLLLRRDRDFFHLYHGAASPQMLAEALLASRAALATETLISDIVGQRATLEPQMSAYAAAGFTLHETLIRLMRLQEGGRAYNGIIDPQAERGNRADAPSIQAFLECLLDRYSEQIPESDELVSLAEAGNILLVRRGAEIGGVLIFEWRGKTATLRYWWVHSRYREQGIGAQLIRSMFYLCRGATRIMLWVIEGNQNAIDKYEHYGFKREGLVDRVMIRSGGMET